MTMAKPVETPEQATAKTDDSVSVVMVGNSYDSANGDVVNVSAEQAASLIANGHAREPYDK